MPSPRYKSLDSIRGLAAFTVVAGHCLVSSPLFFAMSQGGTLPDVPEWQSSIAWAFTYSPLHLLWAGGEAVVLFFVLSGFVLSLLFTGDKPPTYKDYIIRRICRIYVPYVAVVGIAAACMALLGGFTNADASEWANSFWTKDLTVSALASHLAMGGFVRFNYINPPVWSLVHEMRISVIFPLIILSLRIFGWRIALPGFLIFSITSELLITPGTIFRTICETGQYLFHFALGAALGMNRQIVIGWLRKHSALTRALLPLCLLLIVARWMAPREIWPVLAWLSVIAAAGIIACALASPRVTAFLEHRFPLWLGRVSYSLYLSHMVVLLTMLASFRDMLPLWAILIATFPISLIVAHILHITVETPSIRFGRALTAPGKVSASTDLADQARQTASR